MALGQLLKQARLEAGLSQRQLCADEITRNMLSQIENGTARPSMDTLRYLASRLGKSVGYFLEEETVSPNQALMGRAREAYAAGDYSAALESLRDHSPDGTFDAEAALLRSLATMGRAEQALAEGRRPYAAALLRDMDTASLYFVPELERRRLLLLAEAQPDKAIQIAGALPADDRELLLRAMAAQQQGNWEQSARLLDAAQEKTGQWCLLRGKACFEMGEYAPAIEYFRQVEEQALAFLEQCYERLGDYKMAYFYAKKQR